MVWYQVQGMSMATKVAVVETVRGAIEFAKANVAKVVGVLGLVALLNVVSDMAHGWVATALTVIATMLASLMANAALLRLAFAAEHPGEPEFQIGRQGFQFGRPELRLIGAIVLLGLFFLLAILFMLLLAFIFTIALVVAVHGQKTVPTGPNSLPPDVQAMLSLLILLFTAGLLWVAVRVCLYPAATIASRRIQVFSVWKLTQGQWWRIFAAFFMLLLPALVLAAALAASQHQPAVQTAVAIVSAAVNAFVEIPLFCGLYASLYKQLRIDGDAALTVRPVCAGLAGPWG